MTRIILSAICILLLSCTACRGRHADGTPGGETVEVEITPVNESAAKPLPSIHDTIATTAAADTTSTVADTQNPDTPQLTEPALTDPSTDNNL